MGLPLSFVSGSAKSRAAGFVRKPAGCFSCPRDPIALSPATASLLKCRLVSHRPASAGSVKPKVRSLRCARIGEGSLAVALTQKQAADAFGVAPVPVALGDVMMGGLFLRQRRARLSEPGDIRCSRTVQRTPLSFFFSLLTVIEIGRPWAATWRSTYPELLRVE